MNKFQGCAQEFPDIAPMAIWDSHVSSNVPLDPMLILYVVKTVLGNLTQPVLETLEIPKMGVMGAPDPWVGLGTGLLRPFWALPPPEELDLPPTTGG